MLSGSSTIYYLIGWPGSGKRTVGLALAALTGARLLDNHLINDPVFQAVGATGVGSLPEGTWPLVGRVEAAVLEAVMLSPPDLSFIFTNVLVQRPGELETFETRRRLAADRQARFVPAWLLCEEAELRRRIPLEDRRARLKMRDEAGLTRMLEQHGALLSPPQGALILHTDELTPEETARKILESTCS